eukprot:7039889-Alexandrium_andersonii.AAC.1
MFWECGHFAHLRRDFLEQHPDVCPADLPPCLAVMGLAPALSALPGASYWASSWAGPCLGAAGAPGTQTWPPPDKACAVEWARNVAANWGGDGDAPFLG